MYIFYKQLHATASILTSKNSMLLICIDFRPFTRQKAHSVLPLDVCDSLSRQESQTGVDRLNVQSYSLDIKNAPGINLVQPVTMAKSHPTT